MKIVRQEYSEKNDRLYSCTTCALICIVTILSFVLFINYFTSIITFIASNMWIIWSATFISLALLAGIIIIWRYNIAIQFEEKQLDPPCTAV